MVGPIASAQRLRDAAVDGRIEALAEVHDLSLVVMFGSASRVGLDLVLMAGRS